MVRQKPDGGWEDKPLEEWTEEEMRIELRSWEKSIDQRINRVLEFIEQDARFLRQENERLWKALEGSRK